MQTKANGLDMKSKYDIFISYRRDSGAQYARILQLMLIQRGYKVFLDYDELRDGTFSERIKLAIQASPVFMPVLSANSMKRCVNEDDWVRKEILLALQEGKHFVPIDPDRTYDGMPNGVPEELKAAIDGNQHSEISFGQLLGASVDQMISDRLENKIGSRTPQENRDTDYDAAQETLKRIDAHNKFMKRLGVASALIALSLVAATCLFYWHHSKEKEALTDKRIELQEKHGKFNLMFNEDLSMAQMETIDTLLSNMSEIYPDSIWMSQFEFTIGQWYGIKGAPYDIAQKNMPMTNVSFADVSMYLMDLSNMTNLLFELPSIEVWEYAAHGGSNRETTRYVGDDNVEKVAWYKENSNGQLHPSDGQQGKEPNTLDLYDMSGNVGELCNTPFDTNGLYTICGGNYDSPASEVTVNSRKGFDTNAKDKHVGFRIIIRKPK
jgi:hypothetical protein